MIFLSTMNSFLVALFALITCSFRTRAALQTEILALRHQLAVLQPNTPRLRLKRTERVLWVLLSRFWSEWRRCLRIVQPDTVIRWHRRAFALHRRWKSRRRRGRPDVNAETRDLIRRMSQANRLWGVPRIHGGTAEVGDEVAPSTVAKYLRWHRKPVRAKNRSEGDWRGMMAAPDERKQMDTPARLRHRFGQSGTAFLEGILGCRKSHSAHTPGDEYAVGSGSVGY